MMARESKIDEDCEELSVAADPWNLKLKLSVNRVGLMPFEKKAREAGQRRLL